MPPPRMTGQLHGQRNQFTGESMEPAVKHTYLCETDEWYSEKTEVSIAPNSFAQGGMRKCHVATERTVDGRGATYSVESVAKFSIIHRDERGAKAAAFADAKMQMVAEFWAQQFNRKSPAQHKVAFVVAQVLELPSRQGSQRWASLEPLLSGEYNKFNNNAGAVLGGRLAQAFSHFTVHETGGQLCVCDLQGVGGSLFTDPQIHARGGGFGDGNLGSGGIERFLASHRCNEICQAVGLPKVQTKAPSRGGGMMGGGGGMVGGGGMPMMIGAGGGGGGGGFDLGALMRGGMGGGAGMSVGMNKLFEQIVRGGMGGGGMGGGGNMRMFVNGREVDPRDARAQGLVGGMGAMQIAGGGGGGHGGGGHGGGGHGSGGGGHGGHGARNGGHGGGGHGGGGRGGHAHGGDRGGDDQLRAAMRASNEAATAEEERRVREAIAASGGAHAGARANAGMHGRADLDLQRALEASVRQQQHMPGQRRR